MYRRRRRKLTKAQEILKKRARGAETRSRVLRLGIAASLATADTSEEIDWLIHCASNEMLPAVMDSEKLWERFWATPHDRLRARTSVNRRPRAKAKKSAKTK
jgi:hypothetical protein